MPTIKHQRRAPYYVKGETQMLTASQEQDTIDAASIVDELGRIKTELEILEQRRAAMADLLLANYADLPDTEGTVVMGRNFDAALTAVPEKVAVANIRGIFNTLGERDFLKIATVGAADLRKHLSLKDLNRFCTVERTGKRQVRLKRKEQA